MGRLPLLTLLSLVLVYGFSCNVLCSASSPSTGDDDSNINKGSAISKGLRTIGKLFLGFKDAIAGERQERTPKTVEVALVGFGRTGTTSMVAALQLLGYTMQHDDSLFEVADLHGRLADKDDAFSIDDFVGEVGHRGFDGIFFYSDEFLQWAARTEGVKVLLTKRDTAKKWAESWLIITPNVDSIESRPFVWFKPFRDLTPGYFQLIYKHISTQGQPDKYKDLPTLEAAYEAHLVKVRKMIPSDRLLEFNVKEGWGPLCDFLEKPVPDTDFPHVNDRNVAKVIVYTLVLFTWIWPIVPLLVLYFVWRLLRMLFGPTRNNKAAPPARSKKRN